MPSLVDVMPNLTSLALHSIIWERENQPLMSALKTLICLPTLHSLLIENLRAFPAEFNLHQTAVTRLHIISSLNGKFEGLAQCTAASASTLEHS